jgi:hypothetical protein
MTIGRQGSSSRGQASTVPGSRRGGNAFGIARERVCGVAMSRMFFGESGEN